MEELESSNKADYDKIIGEQKSIATTMETMNSSIVKVKELLKKTQDIKNEIKLDIMDTDKSNDELIEKIGKDFILDTLTKSQDQNEKYL